MAIKVDFCTNAFLLNRYVALVRQIEYNTRGTAKENVPITTKKFLQIQWRNIFSDLRGFFSNPITFAPRIVYSLLAFFYIVQSKYLEATMTSFFFMGSISFDDASPSDDSGEVASITYSHTIGSGSDRYAIWDVQGFGGVLSSTFGGNSPTTVINKSDDQKVWGYVNPSTGSSDIVVSRSGGNSIMTSVALSFTGVDQSTPTGATNYAEGSSPLDISLTTTTNNAMRVDFGVAINDTATNITSSLDAGTFGAEWNNGHNQFRVYTAVYYNLQAVAGADTYQWTINNSGFYRIAYAVEIIAETGGGASTALKDVIGVGVVPFPR